MTWGPPYSVDLGENYWAYVGPGVGLVLTSEKSPAPGRILFIGHHSAYEVSFTLFITGILSHHPLKVFI